MCIHLCKCGLHKETIYIVMVLMITKFICTRGKLFHSLLSVNIGLFVVLQPPSRGHGDSHGTGSGQWKLSNLMKPNNLMADAHSQAGSQASSAPSSQFSSPAKRQGINLLDEVVRHIYLCQGFYLAKTFKAAKYHILNFSLDNL